MTDDSNPRAVVVGTGRVGSALVRTLPERGVDVVSVVSRRPNSARERLGPDVLVRGRSSVGAVESDYLILAVPDDHVAEVARQMALEQQVPGYRCVLHTSGMLTSTVLHPFQDRGCDVVAFHPVVAFPPPALRGNPFYGAAITLEGTPGGIDAGRRLAQRLGGHPIQVDADQKQAIHAAAAIVANFTTVLVGSAEDVLVQAGMSDGERMTLLMPLLRSVVENLAAAPPGDALTGPIVRGDVAVVQGHLSLLGHLIPEVLPLYRALGRAATALSLRGGRIDSATARRFEELMTDDRTQIVT